jgi:hypothetical protein
MISNAELDRRIAELRTHPVAEDELRELKDFVVSLSHRSRNLSNTPSD